MSAKAKKTGRFVCPRSGDEGVCAECQAPFRHVVEEWVVQGQRIPACETHKLKLVQP